MGDIADKAQAHEEFMRDLALSNRPDHLAGPTRCGMCGEPNDRAKQGYAACSDCVEGV